MIRTGTTLILGRALNVKVSYGTLSVKPYWPETDQFLCAGLSGSPGRLLYVIGSFRPSFCSFIYPFVRYFPTLTSYGWLHSSQIWTVIHHRVTHPSSVDITCLFGLGRGQNVGFWYFARFWLCCHQGHPCFINKFYCPITLKEFKKYIVDSWSRGQSLRSFFAFYMWNLIGTTHITAL